MHHPMSLLVTTAALAIAAGAAPTTAPNGIIAILIG